MKLYHWCYPDWVYRSLEGTRLRFLYYAPKNIYHAIFIRGIRFFLEFISLKLWYFPLWDQWIIQMRLCYPSIYFFKTKKVWLMWSLTFPEEHWEKLTFWPPRRLVIWIPDIFNVISVSAGETCEHLSGRKRFIWVKTFWWWHNLYK